MKHSKTKRLYLPMPKLRVRAINKSQDKNKVSYSTFDKYNDTAEDTISFKEDEDIVKVENLTKEASIFKNNIENTADTIINIEQPVVQMLDYEDYQFPYSKSLLGILDDDPIYDDDDDEPLFDHVTEEPTSTNNNVLEEESSDFKGFDGEYGPYFPNFTSAMLFIWITKHMICE